MGTTLKTMYKRAKLTSNDVCTISRGVNASGGNDANTRSWAKCSTYSNMYRDMMRKFRKRNKARANLEIYAQFVPSWDCIKCEPKEELVYFNVPHERYCHELEQADDVGSFLPVEGHPLVEVMTEWKENVNLDASEPAAALGLWGDTAVFADASVLLLLYNIVGVAVATERHWFCVIGKHQLCACGCHGRHTYQALFRVFAWSMRCLVTRVFPVCRDDDKTFEDSEFRGDSERHKAGKAKKPIRIAIGCVQKRGDWSWHKAVLNLVDWANREYSQMCYKCMAGTEGRPMTDFCLGAKWRTSLITHTDFLRHMCREGKWISNIFDIPGFRHKYITADLMHTGDIGIVPDSLGLPSPNRALSGIASQGFCFFNKKKKGLRCDHNSSTGWGVARGASKTDKNNPNGRNYVEQRWI